MSRVCRVAPGRNLIEAVVDLLPAGETDYSEYLVVFAGKRPAHFLRRSLAMRKGSALLPPEILSLDGFVEYLCKMGGHENNLIGDMEAAGLLFSQRQTNGLTGAYYASLDRFLPLGIRIFGELEELKLSGVSPNQIRLHVPPGSPLAALYDTFYGIVEREGKTTRALRYHFASTVIPRLEDLQRRKIILVELTGLTRTEERIIEQTQALKNSVLVFHEGEVTVRKMRGLNQEVALVGEKPLPPTVHLYKSPDAHGQVFGLSTILSTLQTKGETIDDRTVVVLPSSDILFPVYQFALNALPSHSYNVSLGYPITRTPVYGFLTSLMGALRSRFEERFFVPEYISFILHPYTKNIRFKGSAEYGRVLFHSLEQSFLGTKAKRFFTLETLEKDAALHTKIARHLSRLGAPVSPEEVRNHLAKVHSELLTKLTSFSDIGDCARKHVEVLEFVAEQSTARNHWLFDPFFATILARLEDLGASSLSREKLMQTDDYLSLIRQCLNHTSVAFSGTPLQGLQVLGVLETRNLQFDRVIVLDANDDVLPGEATRDLFLTHKIREALALPTEKDRDSIAKHHWESLIAAAKEVHCFYIEKGNKPRSRFVEQLIWEKQKKRRDLSEDVNQMEYAIRLTNPRPSPIPKDSDIVDRLKGFTFSATSLDTYLNCGLRFYYTYILEMQKREDAEGAIDRADIGKFVHRILKEVFAPCIGRPLHRDDFDQQQIEALIDRRFEEEFGSEDISGRFLLRNQVRNHVIDFIQRYQLPLVAHERVRVLSVEERIASVHHSVAFKAFLDRVEERKGIVYILDYKTGGVNSNVRVRWKKLNLDVRSSWPEAIGSLQLPLYSILYSREKKIQVENIQPAYLSLGSNHLSPSIELPLFDAKTDPRESLAVLDEIVGRLIGEIQEVETPFPAPANLEKSCPRCPFTTLCGTRWVEEPRWN